MEDKVAKGRHPKSLTPKQVLAIQEAYCGKPRPSQQQLAERFGVHQTTISNVIRGVGY
jgi:DNA-binding MarR family transcriptional regulator